MTSEPDQDPTTPDALLRLLRAGVEHVALDPDRLPNSPGGTPLPELGLLGPAASGIAEEHDFAEAMPGAWPIALDGGGGFYALDLRATADADGAAVVWSHGGDLGWDADQHVLVAPDVATLLAWALP
ncbi:SMI1/KNR4 family protein [Cellulomonas triticagri]|uniref:SMI1/KNR4 family protein n=1 Tax=Cellulomonas triticagri TaxID=2483352 RepID=A0A3M2JGH0_9CELL|nr:SMI1/KNR4 family protein [Cellulomonas triticagri]RMI12922.1 SMI1/KNR4 family protein [Cellulomonas triticagri]